MKKKEFKMLMATNPVLYQWIKENALWLRARPEVMMYLTQHPDALKFFKAGQQVDQERIHRNAQQYMNQIAQEKQSRKRKEKKQETEAKAGQQSEKKKKGLFSGLRAMFNKPVVAPASAQLPVIHPPGMRAPGHKGVPAARPLPKPAAKPALRIPKVKISRTKLMSTLNQTTEMLDVVAALMGKVGNLK